MSDGALHFSIMHPVGLQASSIAGHEVRLGSLDMIFKSVCVSYGGCGHKSSSTGTCAGICVVLYCAGGHWEWTIRDSAVAAGTAAAGLVASAAIMPAATTTAAVAMFPRFSVPSVASAAGLIFPVLAVPVVLTAGGGIVLTSGPGVRLEPSSCIIAASLPACEVGPKVLDATLIVGSDVMPLIVGVMVTVGGVVFAGVALLLLVV